MNTIYSIKTLFICTLFIGVCMGTTHAQGLGGAPATTGATAAPATTTTATATINEETGMAADNSAKVERILKPANERARIITERMVRDLELTDEQAKKVYLINLEAAQQMDVIRKQYRKEPDKIVKEGHKVDMEHDKKLSNILRPNQWAKYRFGKGRG